VPLVTLAPWILMAPVDNGLGTKADDEKSRNLGYWQMGLAI